MDGEISPTNNGWDDTRRQCHGKTPSGRMGSAVLTYVTNFRCDLHLSTDQMSWRNCIRSRWDIQCRWPQLGGCQKWCQPGHHDTCELRSRDCRVGNSTRATVWYCTPGSGTIYMQTRPKRTPHAKTNSKDMSWKWVHTIQQRGDTLAGSVNGRTSNVQGAAQPMNQETQGSRGNTQNHYQDIRHCPREYNSCPSGMSPSSCTRWEWSLVVSQRSKQTRWFLTPPQLTSHIHPLRTAHNPMVCTYDKVRA